MKYLIKNSFNNNKKKFSLFILFFTILLFENTLSQEFKFTINTMDYSFDYEAPIVITYSKESDKLTIFYDMEYESYNIYLHQEDRRKLLALLDNLKLGSTEKIELQTDMTPNNEIVNDDVYITFNNGKITFKKGKYGFFGFGFDLKNNNYRVFRELLIEKSLKRILEEKETELGLNSIPEGDSIYKSLYLPSEIEISSLLNFINKQERERSFYYSDFTYQDMQGIIIMESERLNRIERKNALYFYKIEDDKYIFQSLIGQIESIGRYNPLWIADQFFKNKKAPFPLPDKKYKLTFQDVNSDGIRELVIPNNIGLGAEYEVDYFAITDINFSFIGSVLGLQLIVDSDNNGENEFIGWNMAGDSSFSDDDYFISEFQYGLLFNSGKLSELQKKLLDEFLGDK